MEMRYKYILDLEENTEKSYGDKLLDKAKADRKKAQMIKAREKAHQASNDLLLKTRAFHSGI